MSDFLCPVIKADISTQVCQENHGPEFGCPSFCPHYLFGRHRLDELLTLERVWGQTMANAMATWGKFSNSRRKKIERQLGLRALGPKDEVMLQYCQEAISAWTAFMTAFHPSLGGGEVPGQINSSIGTRDGAILTGLQAKFTARLLKITDGVGPFYRARDLFTDEELDFHRLDVPGSSIRVGMVIFGLFYQVGDFHRMVAAGGVVDPLHAHVFVETLTEKAQGQPLGAWCRDNFLEALKVHIAVPQIYLSKVDIVECVALYRYNANLRKIKARLEASGPDIVADEGDAPHGNFTITQKERPPLGGSISLLTTEVKTGRHLIAWILLLDEGLGLRSSSNVCHALAKAKIEQVLGHMVTFEREVRRDIAAQAAERGMGLPGVPGLVSNLNDPSIPEEMRAELIESAREQALAMYATVEKEEIPMLKGTLIQALTRNPSEAEEWLVGLASNLVGHFGEETARQVVGGIMDRVGVPADMPARVWRIALRQQREEQSARGPVQPDEDNATRAEMFKRGGYSAEYNCSVGELATLGCINQLVDLEIEGEIVNGNRTLFYADLASGHIMKLETQESRPRAFTLDEITEFIRSTIAKHGPPQVRLIVSKALWMSSEELLSDAEAIANGLGEEGMSFEGMSFADRVALVAWGKSHGVRIEFNGDDAAHREIYGVN